MSDLYAEQLEMQLRFAEEEKEQAVAMAYQQGIADEREENEQDAYHRGYLDGQAKCSFDNELKIRAEVIEEFVKLCDSYCHFDEDKHPSNGYVISRASLLDIAEKLEGKQNE